MGGIGRCEDIGGIGSGYKRLYNETSRGKAIKTDTWFGVYNHKDTNNKKLEGWGKDGIINVFDNYVEVANFLGLRVENFVTLISRARYNWELSNDSRNTIYYSFEDSEDGEENTVIYSKIIYDSNGIEVWKFWEEKIC